MPSLVLMAGGRMGLDSATCHNMEEVRDFLRSVHKGHIHAYIDGCIERHFIVPRGLGNVRGAGL